jgi:hypothetical protein
VTEKRKGLGSGRALLIALGLTLCVFLAGFAMLYVGMHQDTVWKWSVRGKAKPDELRAWASQVISNERALPAPGRGTRSNDYLTNAPTYITSVHRVEMMLPDPRDGTFTIVYGGALYHWGLTIGETNLSENKLISHRYAEKWAPGIYYWSE